MREDIKEKYLTEIEFRLEENVTTEIQKISQNIQALTGVVQETQRHMEAFSGILLSTIGTSFLRMANDVTEVRNRMELLNSTVIDTGLNFMDLVEASNQSRTSLKNFSEFFTRIGMSSGHYFQQNPQDLIRVVSTLSRQFQMMHLIPSQLISVQTAILDAFELGYFDWRHMKAGLSHDNPLFRGYIDQVRQASGMGANFDIAKASREHQFTAEGFLKYILDISNEIEDNFERLQITLGQFSSILKNEVVLAFDEIIGMVAWFVDKSARILLYLKQHYSFIIYIVDAYGEALVIVTAMVGLMKTMQLVMVSMKSLAAMIFPNAQSPVGALLGLLSVVAGGLFVTKLYKQDTMVHHVPKPIEDIAKDVHSIASKMDITRETLNDLVSRTESMIIHHNIQNNMTLGGTITDRAFAEQLTNVLSNAVRKNAMG